MASIYGHVNASEKWPVINNLNVFQGSNLSDQDWQSLVYHFWLHVIWVRAEQLGWYHSVNFWLGWQLSQNVYHVYVVVKVNFASWCIAPIDYLGIVCAKHDCHDVWLTVLRGCPLLAVPVASFTTVVFKSIFKHSMATASWVENLIVRSKK